LFHSRRFGFWDLLIIDFLKRQAFPPPVTGFQFFLKCLRAFPGEKTVRPEKSLPGGKLPFVIFLPRAGKAGRAD
jgi:hypothetical protein